MRDNVHRQEEYQSEAGERYFQTGTALHRVLTEAPYLPRCSDNKTATRVRPREYAIRYPYMQVNRRGFVSWLIFDLDHDQAMIWDDVGLPAPNLIVRNRISGHSHLYYAIVPVCTTENARGRPIAFMKAVYAAFAARLRADADFHSGPVAKTPGHPWWLTQELHSHVHELGELADYVDLPLLSPWGRTPQLEAVSHSRHCMLFELLRHFAYRAVGREREHGSLASFTRVVEAYANDRNSFRRYGFPDDLPQSSIRATVRSVARWTWSHYRGTGRCNRGVMGLDPSLPLDERQRRAAARTHALRHQATADRIRGACRQLEQLGQKLTFSAIARQSGLSRQTVAAARHLLSELSRPTALAVVSAVPAPGPVKYGAYQVTAQPGTGEPPAPCPCPSSPAAPPPSLPGKCPAASSSGGFQFDVIGKPPAGPPEAPLAGLIPQPRRGEDSRPADKPPPDAFSGGERRVRSTAAVVESSQDRLITFTRIHNARGLMAKRLRIENGRLVKEAAANLIAGFAQRETCADLHEFAGLLQSLAPADCLVYGIAPMSHATLTTAARARPGTSIARTRKYFSWPTGAGIWMIDYDPEVGEAPLTRDALRSAIINAMPELEGAAMLWTASASSCIYDGQGRELAGLLGQRLYIPVSDATAIPALGETLYRRLWLAGHGRIERSSDGKRLRRALVDASVWQPERIDFAAGASCDLPLVQCRPDPVIYGNPKTLFDSTCAIPLSPEEVWACECEMK